MLRNRNKQETGDIKGVSLAIQTEDLVLGQFELLQNWIPSEIYSIKKKRGVQALSTGSVTPTVPSPCP